MVLRERDCFVLVYIGFVKPLAIQVAYLNFVVVED
jgi:hypothetical protein